jgi:Tfp pilus assembly protein PilO
MRFGFKELVFMVLMAGLLVGGYFFVMKPAVEKRAVRRADIERKKTELSNLRVATAGISDLERKITELQEAISFFESKLPEEREMDKLLKEVWKVAKDNHLHTKSIKTLKAERFAGYNEQPVEISLSGDFKPSFYSFLQQIEKLSRITRIHKMKLEKISSRDGEMHAELTLSIFFESGDGKEKTRGAPAKVAGADTSSAIGGK